MRNSVYQSSAWGKGLGTTLATALMHNQPEASSSYNHSTLRTL